MNRINGNGHVESGGWCKCYANYDSLNLDIISRYMVVILKQYITVLTFFCSVQVSG